MPELTVAQAYRLDPRFGWLWYLGASRPVTSLAGVRLAREVELKAFAEKTWATLGKPRILPGKFQR